MRKSNFKRAWIEMAERAKTYRRELYKLRKKVARHYTMLDTMRGKLRRARGHVGRLVRDRDRAIRVATHKAIVVRDAHWEYEYEKLKWHTDQRQGVIEKQQQYILALEQEVPVRRLHSVRERLLNQPYTPLHEHT